MSVIEEMNTLRESLGLTYQEMSMRSGIPVSTIQKIFGGITKNPRVDTVRRLETVLFDCQAQRNRENALGNPPDQTRKADTPTSFTQPGEEKNSSSAVHEPGIRFGVDGTAASKQPHYYTIEERDALWDDRRTELLDGVLYDMASPVLNHQRVGQAIYIQLYTCMLEHPSDCEIFLAPADVVLPGKLETVLVPDLFIVCDESKAAHKKLMGAPDFVLEVLSPSTAYMDRHRKLSKYLLSGVREYWIADIQRRKVYVYWFDTQGEDFHPTGDVQDVIPDYDLETYTFADRIPVGISEGRCVIDMNEVAARLRPED